MDFGLFGIKLDDSGQNVVKVPVITLATGKDHDDVHYLYRLRKALVLLVGADNMSGYDEDQLIEIHTAIVGSLTANGIGHYYSDWDSDLDSTLPENLKVASNGFTPPQDESFFGLEDEEKAIYLSLKEFDVVSLWSAPTNRKDIPASHFIDQKNKKYPYKNPDGTVNCGGLKAAIQAAGGARGAPKRPAIKAKAQKLYKKYCQKDDDKKNEDDQKPIIGQMVKHI